MTEDNRPTPLDLVEFLPYACKHLEAPFSVLVSTRTLEEYIQLDKLKKKTGKSIANFVSQVRVSTSVIKENEERGPIHQIDANTVSLTVVSDTQERTVELELKNTIIPTCFLKVVQLCIPYHPHLNKITFRSSPVHEKTINEISNILSKSHLTELCLDESPASRCNCASLLQHQSNLIRLSLNGCGLTDDDCEDLAACLHHRRPAARRLLLLSIASNFIADRGAASLAAMLRTNRRLRYLNIANNQITDTGADAIFNHLIQFPLTQNEILAKRLHNVEYFKLYNDVYAKNYRDAIESYSAKLFEDRSGGRRKTVLKRSNVSIALSPGPAAMAEIVTSATAATVKAVGPNDDPFSASDTRYRDGHLYSVGNTCLMYINLSYNHLSYMSVLKLIEVLRYQAIVGSGLVRATVEGNPLPTASPVLSHLAELQRLTVLRCERAKSALGKSDRNIRKR